MRASGILMGISSIPSKYGIGCFSKEAYEFVDQLEKAGQQYWQILPLGPTGYTHCFNSQSVISQSLTCQQHADCDLPHVSGGYRFLSAHHCH